MKQATLVIVGAGASGLLSGVIAAREGLSVLILEATDKIGTSILRSGNGRCNFSNTHLTPADYNHPEFMKTLVTEDASQRVQHFFEELGLTCYVEEDRLYPGSRVALSVLNVLTRELDAYGVEIHTKTPVERILYDEDAQTYRLYGAENTLLAEAPYVIWAGGGTSFQTIAHELDLGHAALTPLLTPLSCDVSLLFGLSGVRAQANVTLVDAKKQVKTQEYGEVLLRDYGVSGIAVFNVSRYVEPGSRLLLDFAPELTHAEVEALLTQQLERTPGLDKATLFDGIVHPHLGRRLLELLQPGGWDAIQEAYALSRRKGKQKSKKRLSHQDTSILPVTTVDVRDAASLIKQFEIAVYERTELAQAQVTRGGLELREVDPHTLAVTKYPGLFITGEALDVDGRCGGYNLGWAWLSGHAAATEVVRRATSHA